MTHAKQQMEWAVENGVTGKFVIEEGSFGIGLTASEPIAAGDVRSSLELLSSESVLASGDLVRA